MPIVIEGLQSGQASTLLEQGQLEFLMHLGFDPPRYMHPVYAFANMIKTRLPVARGNDYFSVTGYSRENIPHKLGGIIVARQMRKEQVAHVRWAIFRKQFERLVI